MMANLLGSVCGQDYVVRDIATDDEEIKSFLFSLGCFSGESVTVVSRKKNNMTLAIKDARYGIDNELASVILV